MHGQSLFNYRHPHIRDGLETELIVRAFQRDFEVNGPSVVRMARTMLAGWKRHKNHPDPRVRRRFAWEARDLVHASTRPWSPRRGFTTAAIRRLRAKMDALLKDLHREFGLKSRFYAAVGGRYVYWKMRREEKRLARGWTYEPPTFYERNEAAQRLASGDGPPATLCRPLTCRGAGLPTVAAAAGLPEAVAVG